MNIEITRFTPASSAPFSKEEIVDFLAAQLDEFGDRRSDILASIEYACGSEPGRGGSVLVAYSGEEIAGAAVINQTNMGGYIPENILVYIAVHRDYRGRGVGSRIMEKVIKKTDGDIALHVEPHNPAKHLYEKFGFENKYLEMRLKKKDGVS